MKMDLKSLCRQLAQANEEETVSSREVNPYLLNQVLRPLIREDCVRLMDIDFEQFDSVDIRVLASYYESLEMEGRKLMERTGAIAGIEPMACRTRRFC